MGQPVMTEEGKLLALASYGSLLVGLPIWAFPVFVKRDDAFALFHAKQAGAVWAVWLGLTVLSGVVTVITCGLGAPLFMVGLLAWLPAAQGVMGVLNGACEPTLVDPLAQALFGAIELEGGGGGGGGGVVKAFLSSPWIAHELAQRGPPADAEELYATVLEGLGPHLETPVHLVIDGDPLSARLFDVRSLDSDECDYYFETALGESEDLPFAAAEVMPVGIVDSGVYNEGYPVGIYEARYLLLAHLGEAAAGQAPIYVISSHSGLSGSSLQKLADSAASLDVKPGAA